MNRCFPRIEVILSFLKKEKIQYKFYGEKEDRVKGFSTLFNYKSKTMTFVSTLYNFEDYEDDFAEKIELIITSFTQEKSKKFKNVIQVDRPTDTFFTIIKHFFSHEIDNKEVLSTVDDLIKSQSYVSKNALIGKNVKIGHGCVIEPNVTIGDNTILHHNVIIRAGTKIGNNCTIKSGTVIGEQGFNPTTQKDGSKRLLEHYGGVIIEDDVYIGSNCNIHRGSIDDTVIQKGVKLNTMVHIAHNCIIGQETVVTFPTFFCGSVKIGKHCHIAATTIRNQVTVGDYAVLGLGAVVIKDVPDHETVVGVPAKPLKR